MAKRHKLIRAGNLVSEVIYTAPQPSDSARVRDAKSRATSEAQKRVNMKTARRKMEMRIAANFDAGDLFVTLTFDNEHLPSRREGAIVRMRTFLRLLRAARKVRGDDLRYIYVLEGQHGEARLHFHVFINATGPHDNEDIKSLWACGDDVDIKHIERDGYFALAEYVTKEKKPVGARSWVCSLNLKQPIIESSFVPDSTRLQAPPSAFVIEREEKENGLAGFQYVKYWMPPCVEAAGKHKRRKRKRA